MDGQPPRPDLREIIASRIEVSNFVASDEISKDRFG
jgi:hypothetical protein